MTSRDAMTTERSILMTVPKHPSPLPRWFHPWAVWLAGGKRGARPAIAPAKIPPWAWALLPAVAAALKASTAPPPTKPALALQPPFDGRGAFTAWGFESGQFSDVDALARELVAAGFTFVLPQLGQADPSTAGVFRNHGLHVVPWGIVDDSTLSELLRWQPDGFVPQVEGPDQRSSLVRLLASAQLSIPVACVTTGGGIGDIPAGDRAAFDEVRLILDRVPLAVMECYEQDEPGHANVEVMCWQVQHYTWIDEAGTPVAYGFRQALPVVGLYHDVELAAYPGLRGPFCVWLAETMARPRDLDAVKAVAA